MEGNSCSNTCLDFDAVNDKNEPEDGFDELVHVKEEVLECLKEEAAWEDSTVGEEAALASLYAGHEVKDELVLGPEGLQPQDVAFTLHAAQALAVKKQHKLRDCEVRLERIDAPAPLIIQQLHVLPGTEQEVNVLARPGGRGETRGGGSTGEYGHCCQTCNNTFTTPSHLKIHERIHTGERPYSCGTCNKEFKQLNNLKTHERTHSGERPYSCGTCNKEFTQSSNLKRHARTHTGERSFACRTCNNKFTRLNHLQMHERTHTGERPFSCRICKKKFTTSSNLKSHARIHTGERPFACRTCNNKFKRLNHLQSHERTHTGKKPFSCVICKKKFAHSNRLKSHERTHGRKTIHM